MPNRKHLGLPAAENVKQVPLRLYCPTCGERMAFAFPSCHPTTIINDALNDLQFCRNAECRDQGLIRDSASGLIYAVQMEWDNGYRFLWKFGDRPDDNFSVIEGGDRNEVLERWIRDIRRLNPSQREASDGLL